MSLAERAATFNGASASPNAGEFSWSCPVWAREPGTQTDPLRTLRRLWLVARSNKVIQVSARIFLCIAGITGLAACDTDDRSAHSARPVTSINVEHGLPSLEAQSRVPYYVLISSDETASIWRADGDEVVTVSMGEISSGLSGLSAGQVDPLLLFAEHNPPAGQMIEVVQSLKDEGFSSVALVAPGGWVPPVPTEAAAPK